MEFGWLYARMPEGGPGQLSPGPGIKDSLRAPRGVDTCLPLNVFSPPPSGRGMTGRRDGNSYNACRIISQILFCVPSSRYGCIGKLSTVAANRSETDKSGADG